MKLENKIRWWRIKGYFMGIYYKIKRIFVKPDPWREQLMAKYSKLFVQKDWNMQETCMCWGIEVGDGWKYLLDDLCKDLMDYCEEQEIEPPQFTQIKEKYGGLRAYLNGAPEGHHRLFDIASEYENLSERVCEVCGKYGRVRNIGGWYTCYCEEHYQKRIKK